MSDRAQVWALRLLALGTALGLWFNFSFQAREAPSERLIEAGVSYNTARGLMVLDPLQSVNVRVRGSSSVIRKLSPFQVAVQVNLTRAEPGTFNVTLGTDSVLMPDNLELVSIEPPIIPVELEKEVTQRLTVEPKLTGEPAAGATLEEPDVLPNEVLVSGPLSHLAKLKTLPTEPINLDGHALPFDAAVAVLSPDPLVQIIQPFRVLVHVKLLPPQVEQPASPVRKPGRGGPR